jgi:hypothetical protein
VPVPKSTITIAALVLASLAGCAEKPEPSQRKTFELRPVWELGRTYVVREDREEMSGRGPFPPIGDMEQRASQVGREIHVYRVEPIELDGPRLGRARITFTNSSRGPRGGLQPTNLEGRTYEMKDPFAPGSIVESVGPEEGQRSAASQEETDQVRKRALLMAASLVPDKRVARGETWPAGRNVLGMPMEVNGMVPRLSRVRDADGAEPVAEVECVTDLLGRKGPNQDARATLTETLEIDLAKRRILSYRMVEEGEAPERGGRPRMWHRAAVTMTISEE